MATKLGIVNCSICQNELSKYRCPSCGTPTCSLKCCERHKIQTGCSGKVSRLPPPIKSRSDLKEDVLLKDERFFEEIEEMRRLANKDPLQYQSKCDRRLIPAFKYCKKHGIVIRPRPSQSDRHKQNKSRLNRTRNNMDWTVEFVVYGNGERFICQNVINSNDTIESVLNETFMDHEKVMALYFRNERPNGLVLRKARLSEVDFA
ncbi:hypothetical protein ACOME3_001605 [Neoechinorhynchus agilis]